MPEFIELLPPQDALELFFASLQSHPTAEEIDTKQSNGRVVFQDILSPHALPLFTRSTVDGYAVRAADTHGASDALPVYMQVAGEVHMG